MPRSPSSSPLFLGETNSRWQAWNDALNPFLVKEVRQLWKSRQFVVIFFVLLAGAWLVSVTALLAPEVILQFVPFGYGHTGEIHATALFFPLYCCLTVALNFAVPLRAMESLAHEFSDDTLELLLLTRIPPDRITIGKFWCAVMHMGVYLAALGPFLAICYLLPGIDLPSIVLLLLSSLALSCGLCCNALWLGTYCKHPGMRSVMTIVLLAACCAATGIWLLVVFQMLQWNTTSGMTCPGIPCCFVPWLVVSMTSLGRAVVRSRPKSSHSHRIEYLEVDQLELIAAAVLRFAEAVRTQFPVAYDEPPARPPESLPFREAHDLVLRRAREVDRLINRQRLLHSTVLANLPLVPQAAYAPFAAVRDGFYAIIATYVWYGICRGDHQYVQIWPNRLHMPKIPVADLNALEEAARRLTTVCDELAGRSPGPVESGDSENRPL